VGRDKCLIEAFKLHNPADDEEEDTEDEERINQRKLIGTIELEVWDAIYTGKKPKVIKYDDKKFKRRSLLKDKKSSFGVDRAVQVGHTIEKKFYPAKHKKGKKLLELKVFYRTRQFFTSLEHFLNPQDFEDNEKEPKPKHLKRESPFSDRDSLDVFLSRLSHEEEMEIESLKFLLVALSNRDYRTVRELRVLKHDAWVHIMHDAKLPRSLARAVMALLSLPPPPLDVIVIDD